MGVQTVKIKIVEEQVPLARLRYEGSVPLRFRYPSGSKLLSAVACNGNLSLYFEVDPLQIGKSTYTVLVLALGTEIDTTINARFVDTVVFGQETYHVYYLGETL